LFTKALKNEKSKKISNWIKKFFPENPFKIYQSDNGSNLNSKFVKQVIQELNGKSINSSPYHPQTNGQIERPNGSLKSILQALVHEKGGEWSDHLPEATWIYNSTQHSTTKYAPFVVEGILPAKKMIFPSSSSVSDEDQSRIQAEVISNIEAAAKKRELKSSKTAFQEKF